MKILNVLGAICILMLITSCNTGIEVNTKPVQEENVQEVENSLNAEKLPQNGYKGRQNNYIFYLNIEAENVSGFVRDKTQGTEYLVSGKMSSPFVFDAEVIDEEEDGEEVTIAKLRGKLRNNDSEVDLDYNDVNSATSFRVVLKQ